jgi:P27 family predicted phage terminase small subunit
MTRPKRAKAPNHLGTDGAKLFREVAAEYEITDPAGLALLETACAALDRMREAQASIAEHGALVLDRYGAPKMSPACILEKDARAGFVLAMKALSLDLEPLRDQRGRPPGSYLGGRRIA